MESFFNYFIYFFFRNICIYKFNFGYNISFYFLTAYLHKRCQMSKAYALSAVLRTCNLCYNLGCNIASSGKCMRFLNKCSAYYSTVLKHILKVYKVTVMHMLCKIVCIMEMYNSLLMSIYYVFRQQHSLCNILAYFSCHIVSLHTIYGRIFI